ncbi:MAG: lipoprotein insertase outer membrane protein LolB [Steroidobacter sp.]
MPRRRSLRSAFLLLTLALAAGCANLGTRTEVSLPSDLNDLNRWQARGRLGVSGPETGGSGSFDWSQRGDHAEIQIRGPVGIGSVRLELQGEGVRPDLKLETSDGQTLVSDAAWDELEVRLGASLPAGHLRYWMLGLAAPGEHQWLEEQAEGPNTLEQGGWRIDYQGYSTEPGLRVPVRMRATSGDARVRIVVDRWRLGQ